MQERREEEALIVLIKNEKAREERGIGGPRHRSARARQGAREDHWERAARAQEVVPGHREPSRLHGGGRCGWDRVVVGRGGSCMA